VSSPADALIERYTPELRGLGGALPEEYATAARALSASGALSLEQLQRWSDTGVTLARHSLRSWEAASEFFKTSPALVNGLTFDGLIEWAEIAMRLSESSSLIAAAFLRSTPSVLAKLPPPGHEDVGLGGQYQQGSHIQYSVKPWADLGERLYHNNWKSIGLASLFFDTSELLLDSLTMRMTSNLVDLINALAQRSYQLAGLCLEGSPVLFAALSPPDRQPFIAFAHAVADASWADTRLYFDRGPVLLQHIEAGQRARFLELAARVTGAVGRYGFPLFVDAAEALAQIDRADHELIITCAERLAPGSPLAAMLFLRSTPYVLERLSIDQLGTWYEEGRTILYDERNTEGAEAYYRLESARSEEVLLRLSARVELSRVLNTLRLYSKALTGEAIAIRSTEDLVEAGIGWVQESVATTEGTSIFLPPHVSTYGERQQNYLTYKVYTTHQTGRIEFGSFAYRFGRPGRYSNGSLGGRITTETLLKATVTEISRFYDLFEERALIAALFTIAEDTRIDAYVSREYGGVRNWLRQLQSDEVDRRSDVSRLPLRNAYVENLLRASLKRTDATRWPQVMRHFLADGIGALRVIEQVDATVQDSADVAATLYDLALRIPNTLADGPAEDWAEADDEMISMSPAMPGGAADGEPQPTPSSSEEPEFQAPTQPEFRGDFKPELVQLMMRLKQQQGGQGDTVSAPLTREQLMEMLENSPELMISDIAEGDFASSVGLFLTNLEKEGGTPKSDSKAKRNNQDDPGEDGGADGDELPVEIHYSYYDEWDFRASDYRPRWCRVGERLGEEGELDYYQEVLRKHHGLVTETRRQFEMMRPESFRRIKRLEDGEEIDLDQAIEFLVDKAAGVGPLGRIYWRRNKIERDVAVAFLIDMSASTDEEIEKQKTNYAEEEEFDGDPRRYFQWLAQRRAKLAADPPKRIIDLEKESLVLVVEALEAIGDSYGIFGFSGYGRDNVEYHVIKDLGETFSDRVRKRIDKIQPVRSTRMGPAIRHTVDKLTATAAKAKLLIMVSDGRPQDHGYGRDRTEKDYAVHDTHQALIEAKRAGITPFLITVDKEGHDYLGQMCDDLGYEVVDNIEMLPRRLTSLYRALSTE